MMIKQISIFMKNEPGRLLKVTKILADSGIDIRALTVAETADFGILRLIVNEPDKAYRVLKEKEIAVVEHDVLGVEVNDRPGGLARIAEILNNEGINIEYMYAFVTKSHEKAYVVLRLDDLEKGKKILEKKGIRLVTTEELSEI
ncbi:MAG: ACT domain-containing protein [Candidatus Altiarchaeota archaeon]|nr:ACT domain-containing protein [Candidatus Altiarchaeota archaeon]